jgi:TolB-like protein
MSLIAELQRRKVFKVGAAYLVVGWLLIQVAATVAPQLNLPEWAPRLITFVILLGFPIAILLAWAVDISADGIKLEGAPFGNKRIAVVVAVLVVLALGWYFYGQPAFRKGDARAPEVAIAPAPFPKADSHSIAVLPFVNMSDDKENEYFSDGLSEQLLNQLAQIQQLKVIARTSSFSFKGKEVDITTIAKALNVANVLEGSVRKSGNTLRITAQLIRTSDSTHLWSQTYDRELTDIFKVQDEISAAIASALEARIVGSGEAGKSAGPSNPEAYDAYLLARSLVARRVGDNLPLAIKAFDRAIAKDPTFSPAYSGRAFAYAIGPGWSGTLDVKSSFDKSLADADQALRMDPDNAEAYMVRGTVRSILFQEDSARVDLDRALALAPGSVDILNFVGDDYQYIGDLRAAERMKRQAMALDPLAFVHPQNLASILSGQGRFGDAVAQAQHSVELGGASFARYQLFVAQLRLGNVAGAADTVNAICKEIGEDKVRCISFRLAVSAARGDKAATERLSNQLMAKRGQWADQAVFPSDVAMIYANFVGDIAKATLAIHDSLTGYDYNVTIALLYGPRGARLPEEISRDPEWLAVWNDPKLRETMAAYRANLAKFRSGG